MFSSVLRRWKLVLLVAAALLVTVYAVLQIQDDTYRIEAKLLVKVGRENLEVPATVARGSLVSTGVRKEDINSEVALLKSQHLLEKTIDKVGVEKFFVEPPPPASLFQLLKRSISGTADFFLELLETILVKIGIAREYTDREMAIMSVADNLIIGRDGESDVLKIQMNYPNPDLGAEVMSTLIENFMTERLETRRAAGTEVFFEKQVTNHNEKLAALDEQLNALRRKQKVTSVQEERPLLLERRREVTSQISQINSTLTAVAPLSELVGDSASGTEAVSAGGARYAIVFDRISELLVQRAIALEQLAPTSKRVLELESQIGNLVLLLQASAQDALDNFTSELSRIDERLEILSEVEIKIENLYRQRERMQKQLDTDSDKLEEARVDSQLDLQRVANIAVLSAPTQDIEPAGPRRMIMTIISMPIGLILGLIFAAVLGYFDKRIYTSADISALRDVNYLGKITPDPETQRNGI